VSISLTAEIECWPLAKPFVISRGSKTHAEVVVVTVEAAGEMGRGECVPYTRYGESCDNVLTAIEGVTAAIEGGANRQKLQNLLPAGAARNAIDCAFWDLECGRTGKSIWQMLDQKLPKQILSVQTISIGTPQQMQMEAKTLANFPMLKVKLDAVNVCERVAAVRAGAPKSQLIIDANESWSLDLLNRVVPQLEKLGVGMIEQPVPAGQDQILAGYTGSIVLGADESCHSRDGLKALRSLYGCVNIKLDKTGGLTEALETARTAREMGFKIMVGSMVSTTLALAPALVLAADADFVDLDSPNLLAEDRPKGLTLLDGYLSGLDTAVWGAGTLCD
jgi:L-alanine-DL-glutamate epimerase-like enolase superfamily enzyme